MMKHSLASTPAKPNKKSEVCKRYPQDTLCNITKINLEKNKWKEQQLFPGLLFHDEKEQGNVWISLYH